MKRPSLLPALPFLLLLLGITAGFGVAAAAGEPSAFPSPPGQPATGPGGAEYTHQSVTMTAHFDGPRGYWLFEPADPKPDQAPVIVFSHGWGGIQPEIYGAWIKHLVKRGNIVIYPAYQDHLTTPPGTFTANAVAGVQQALHELETQPGHVKPDLSKFAYAGHSLGGVLSANLAALAEAVALPPARAVMCVEPGGIAAAPLEGLQRIGQNTLLLVVVGDQDRVAPRADAKQIFDGASNIDSANKNFVVLVSDDHGRPALRADHFAPSAPATFTPGPFQEMAETTFLRQMILGQMGAEGAKLRDVVLDKNPLFGTDALDYYGTWKLLDALSDAAFYGRERNVALGNTAAQRFMGLWSDGVPVKQLLVVAAP